MAQERRRQSRSWQIRVMSGLLVVVALGLTGAASSLVAQGEAAGKETLPSASGTVENTTEPAEKEVTPDLGTGNFSRSPFHISVSVREGYDDNVYTTEHNKVGSFFTNG